MAKQQQKKKWFKIIAPKLFNSREVGETACYEPKVLHDRVLKVNMFTLTDNMKKQNTEVTLLINNVAGEKAHTEMTGYKLLPTSIKRLVRKGKTRLDATLKAITKDEKAITIKLFLVTRNIVKGGVFTAIQNETERFVTKRIASHSFDELSEQIVYGKIQKELKARLAKIYPLKICDVREFKWERFIKAVDLRKIKEAMDKAKNAPEPVLEKEEVEETEEKTEEVVEEKTKKTETKEPVKEKAEEKPAKKKTAKEEPKTDSKEE